MPPPGYKLDIPATSWEYLPDRSINAVYLPPAERERERERERESCYQPAIPIRYTVYRQPTGYYTYDKSVINPLHTTTGVGDQATHHNGDNDTEPRHDCLQVF